MMELLKPDSGNYAVLNLQDPVAAAVAKELTAINGIESVVNVQKHSMMILKAELYTWDEIQPSIMAAAKRNRLSARSMNSKP